MRVPTAHLRARRFLRLCTSRGCVDVTEPAGGGGGGGGGGRRLWVGGGGGVGGEAEVSPLLQEAAMRKMVSSLRGASYRPTLPPEIATDAAIYVAVIVVFYAAIILLLVGTNLHRLRRRRRGPSSSPSQPLQTTITARGADASSLLFPTSSPTPASVTTALHDKGRWQEQGKAVPV